MSDEIIGVMAYGAFSKKCVVCHLIYLTESLMGYQIGQSLDHVMESLMGYQTNIHRYNHVIPNNAELCTSDGIFDGMSDEYP